MNKPTFTKGPWTVTDWHIATKDGPIIATINEDENGYASDEIRKCFVPISRANARLIAAAPELLAQCEFLEEMLTRTDHPSSPKLAELRELLAKVEGEK